MAIATLFKLRRGPGVARVEWTRRLGGASGDAKGRFNGCNEGDGGNSSSQTPES